MIFSKEFDSMTKLKTDAKSNSSGTMTTTLRQYEWQHSSTLIIMQRHTTDSKLRQNLMHVFKTTVKQQQQIAIN